MHVIEKIFAAAMLAVCLVLIVRMAIGPRRRSRFDAALGRWRARAGSARPGRWLARPTLQSRAERAAAEAIERARRASRQVDRDGNVYRPKSFKGKKRDLH